MSKLRLSVERIDLRYDTSSHTFSAEKSDQRANKKRKDSILFTVANRWFCSNPSFPPVRRESPQRLSLLAKTWSEPSVLESLMRPEKTPCLLWSQTTTRWHIFGGVLCFARMSAMCLVCCSVSALLQTGAGTSFWAACFCPLSELTEYNVNGFERDMFERHWRNTK